MAAIAPPNAAIPISPVNNKRYLIKKNKSKIKFSWKKIFNEDSKKVRLEITNVFVRDLCKSIKCGSFHLNGKKLWKIHLHGQMLGSPVVSPEGDIYVGVTQSKHNKRMQGRLVCVGGEPHRIKWEYKAQGAVESTPAAVTAYALSFS